MEDTKFCVHGGECSHWPCIEANMHDIRCCSECEARLSCYSVCKKVELRDNGNILVCSCGCRASRETRRNGHGATRWRVKCPSCGKKTHWHRPYGGDLNEWEVMGCERKTN